VTLCSAMLCVGGSRRVPSLADSTPVTHPLPLIYLTNQRYHGRLTHTLSLAQSDVRIWFEDLSRLPATSTPPRRLGLPLAQHAMTPRSGISQHVPPKDLVFKARWQQRIQRMLIASP
jgi:hypothetical protein